MKLIGVILAGGRSLRMGSDKGLIDYHGKPMVKYAIDRFVPLCDDIVISTNSPDYSAFNYQTIPDLVQNIGPIGGIYSVMSTIKADKYFFISCDIPHASGKLAEDLLKNIDKGDIIVPIHSNVKIEPLFAIYSFNILSFVKKQIEKKNYKLMDLLSSSNTYYHNVSEAFLKEIPDIFKNINAPKDVE